jgi:hypothetical protein
LFADKRPVYEDFEEEFVIPIPCKKVEGGINFQVVEH